jgi:hypothetical protein
MEPARRRNANPRARFAKTRAERDQGLKQTLQVATAALMRQSTRCQKTKNMRFKLIADEVHPNSEVKQQQCNQLPAHPITKLKKHI